MSKRAKPNRYSISVSGKTYDLLRAKVPYGGVACFVDDLVTSALEDPAIMARLVDKCRYDESTS